MRKDILESKDKIVKWISDKRSKSYICRELRCKQDTLNSYLTKMGLEYSGNQGDQGYRKAANRKSALEYMTNETVKSHILRKKLIEDGVKKDECEECENDEWMGSPIPLELHHIDGDRFNNQLENLQILCRNCHGLTPNHSGRNKGNY